MTPIETAAASEHEGQHLVTHTVQHDYVTQSGKIVRETVTTDGTVTTVMDFIYDESGRPFALLHYANGAAEPETYYYLLNLQGDVVALMNSNGSIIAKYTYSAWGEVLAITDDPGEKITDETHIAHLNPLRCRGYYYDTETGFYYLQSRYYDPVTHRFINVDGCVSTGQDITGYNMFAYCGNNPVNRKDPTGQSWIAALVVTFVGAVCAALLSGCSEQPSPPANYIQENSEFQNCYSYAFGLPYAANPGDYSVSESDSDCMYESRDMYTTAEIAEFIERDMRALNITVRPVDSPADKLDNEYIVAMKTSTIIIPWLGVADYHFAVLLSDGTWADKPGPKPSRWNALDGTAVTWDLDDVEKYYNTETMYFAVEGQWQ